MSDVAEKAWYAALQEARRLRELKDESGFVNQALAAFNQRPQRAEPLYDLARFYRERRMNDASMLFSEAGLALKRPDGDSLFLEDFVYQAGLLEEFSIAANYSREPARWDRGFAACNWLALNRDVPAGTRNLAMSNLDFYVRPVSTMMPSFAARRVEFAPPEGYRATNPSVALRGEQLILAQRCYTITLDDAPFRTANGAPARTRNFLLRLNGDLETEWSAEILSPDDMPNPASELAMGFEDLRLFVWRGRVWCCAGIRELAADASYDFVLARVDEGTSGPCRLADWRVLCPDNRKQDEKNWMPRVAGETLQFIYLCDPTRVVDDEARTVGETTPAIAAEEFRGGTQVIPFDGGWLALIHEARVRDGRRRYRHRFVRFDEATRLRGVSRPFVFHKYQIEFAAGLAWHPDGERLIVSYGVGDSEAGEVREAWIATVEAGDVRNILEDAERLPSGRPAAIYVTTDFL